MYMYTTKSFKEVYNIYTSLLIALSHIFSYTTYMINAYIVYTSSYRSFKFPADYGLICYRAYYADIILL